MKCPHCRSKFVAHEDGRLHCNGCGCCFLEDGVTVRPGHPVCRNAPVEAAPEPTSEFESMAEPEPIPEPVEDANASPASDEAAPAPEETPSPEVRTRRRKAAE